MMNHTIGFIGCGNMGGAIVNGLVSQGIAAPEQIWICKKHAENRQGLPEKCHFVTSLQELYAKAQIVILAVKPNILDSVLFESRDLIRDHVIISIAAGWNCARLAAALPENCSFVRVMPNICARVGLSASVISSQTKHPASLELAQTIFGAIGNTYVVTESQFDAAATVGGCGPAFVFDFVNSMADAALKNGLPKAMALELVNTMMSGSLKLLSETGLHPAVLQDMVCSPGGTTIEGIHSLRSHQFESIVMDAVQASLDKGKRI